MEKNILIICIGSNKIIGDSLGPLVGTFLKEKYKFKQNIKVIGDYINPVNFNNVKDIEFKDNDITILIDSALGSNVGQIIIDEGYLELGKSLDKKKTIKGNIIIKGIVGLNHKDKIKNFIELKNIEEKLISNMARNIVEFINV